TARPPSLCVGRDGGVAEHNVLEPSHQFRILPGICRLAYEGFRTTRRGRRVARQNSWPEPLYHCCDASDETAAMRITSAMDRILSAHWREEEPIAIDRIAHKAKSPPRRSRMR